MGTLVILMADEEAEPVTCFPKDPSVQGVGQVALLDDNAEALMPGFLAFLAGALLGLEAATYKLHDPKLIHAVS